MLLLHGQYVYKCVCVFVCCVVCCVCARMCVCVHALYACYASFFSVRRMCSWTVQDTGNVEDHTIPPDGDGVPVHDFMDVHPAAQCGDNRDEEAGPSEPRYVTSQC